MIYNPLQVSHGEDNDMINQIITLNLQEYGAEGTVEIGFPTFRRRRELNNQLGPYYKAGVDSKGVLDAQKLMDVIKAGDVDILQTLLFVRSAPFPLDVEGFTLFCDDLDAKNLGAGSALYDDIKLTIERLKEEPGPLENSQ